MVIDTSVLVAIALGESIQERLLDAMAAAKDRALSSMTLLEAGMVLRARFGDRSIPVLYQLVDELVTEVVAFDDIQARLAIRAFGRFGKGMGHKAQLNFGDCAVYALAESRGEPVLAIGLDFAATDLSCIEF